MNDHIGPTEVTDTQDTDTGLLRMYRALPPAQRQRLMDEWHPRIAARIARPAGAGAVQMQEARAALGIKAQMQR